MTVDEIETFVCIADVGGFTEASTLLGRSQPAISRRVRELERSLGAPLFERTGRGAALTDAGKALLPHARAALAAIRDGERAVRDLAGGARPLSVAIVGTLADSHLVEALRAFESRFPDTPVDLRTATSREVSSLVRSGAAALGLRYFPDADPALESVPLGAERLVVVVPASHEVTDRRLPDLGPLRGERWLGFPPERHQPDSFGRLLRRRLAAAGLADPSITLIDSLTAQKRLVEAGLGVALMPVGGVREELRIGSLRTIDVRGLAGELPVVAVRRKDGHRGGRESAFLAELKAHMSELG